MHHTNLQGAKLADFLITMIGDNKWTPPNVGDRDKPLSRNEEILLVLLIAEYHANKEAILNQTPEHAQARKQSYNIAADTHALLAVFLAKFVSTQIVSFKNYLTGSITNVFIF